MAKTYNVTVHVTYKESVLDPQGQAVLGAAERMNFKGIDDVRIGKYFQITAHEVEGTSLDETINTLCDSLLANPNMETYTYSIVEEGE